MAGNPDVFDGWISKPGKDSYPRRLDDIERYFEPKLPPRTGIINFEPVMPPYPNRYGPPPPLPFKVGDNFSDLEARLRSRLLKVRNQKAELEKEEAIIEAALEGIRAKSK